MVPALRSSVKDAAARPGHGARPMADMANGGSTEPLIYDRLSFPDYNYSRPCLDTEWLLSTLFDASLLSTSKAAGNGGSFFWPSLRAAPLGRQPGIQHWRVSLAVGISTLRMRLEITRGWKPY